jgi:hypothetical protein
VAGGRSAKGRSVHLALMRGQANQGHRLPSFLGYLKKVFGFRRPAAGLHDARTDPDFSPQSVFLVVFHGSIWCWITSTVIFTGPSWMCWARLRRLPYYSACSFTLRPSIPAGSTWRRWESASWTDVAPIAPDDEPVLGSSCKQRFYSGNSSGTPKGEASNGSSPVRMQAANWADTMFRNYFVSLLAESRRALDK